MKKTIIIDCPVYPGNSGGPVLEIDRENFMTTRFRIIGIVSEFVPWVSLSPGDKNPEISNSGYSIVTPLDAIRELLSK